MGRESTYLGVSLGSRVFSKEYIRTVLSHAVENYNRILLLIADDPHIYTFMATKGLDYYEAKKRVEKISEEKSILVNRVAREFSGKSLEILIRKWSEISRSHDYRSILLSSHELEGINSKFHEEIIEKFLGYVKDTGVKDIPQGRVYLGSRYILEEFSMMIYLQEVEGYFVQISPEEEPGFIKKFYEREYECTDLCFGFWPKANIQNIVL